MRPEYRREDLGRATRGKYFAAFQKGSNLVLLDSDVAEAFPTSEAVNEALSARLLLANQPKKLTSSAARQRAKVDRASRLQYGAKRGCR